MATKKYYRFRVSIEENEYVVRYLDLPVSGAGKTMKEAFNEAESNLTFYLDYCVDNHISVSEPSMEKTGYTPR